ncbi:hypothetical protein RvVAR031_20180 [Agrobacterium vitis]|nr:hypothetical protein RvVAR031_20180 [Agrobacterium vitis]
MIGSRKINDIIAISMIIRDKATPVTDIIDICTWKARQPRSRRAPEAEMQRSRASLPWLVKAMASQPRRLRASKVGHGGSFNKETPVLIRDTIRAMSA